MSMGQLWGTLVGGPRGTNLYPIAGYVLAQLDSLFKRGDSHVYLRNSRSELRLLKVGRNVKSMDLSADFSPTVRLS